MRDLLKALAAGDIGPREVEASLRGYVTGDAGRYDVARWERRGIPEAILGEGKTPDEAAELAGLSLETTGYALVTRADEATRDAVVDRIESIETDVSVNRDARGRLVAAWTEPRPDLDGRVAILTGGTADATAAREAAAVIEAVGGEVDHIDDIGVAAIDRLLDQLERINGADVVIVAAGREGSLPTVVAGLTACPVIALPVSSGYGAGGSGEAALLGALQSCTVLTTVNVDAGFVAGAQATLIARAIDRARV